MNKNQIFVKNQNIKSENAPSCIVLFFYHTALLNVFMFLRLLKFNN